MANTSLFRYASTAFPSDRAERDTLLRYAPFLQFL